MITTSKIVAELFTFVGGLQSVTTVVKACVHKFTSGERLLGIPIVFSVSGKRVMQKPKLCVCPEIWYVYCFQSQAILDVCGVARIVSVGRDYLNRLLIYVPYEFAHHQRTN